MPHRPAFRRTLIASAVALALLALAGTGISATGGDPVLGNAAAAVAPAVRAAIAAAGRANVLVALRDGVADTAPLPEIAAAVARAQGEVLADLAPGDFELVSRPSVLPILSGYATAEGVERLRRHPRVVAVDDNVWVYPLLKESVPLIKADLVHRRYEITGKGVGVAVLDTGIDTDHPDLADAIVDQQCFSSGTRSCAPNNLPRSPSAEDEQGHGTAVSGIIASRGRQSGVGVAPGASIVAVRVFRDQGGAPTSDIVDGLDWVLIRQNQHNIHVVNMSLGSGGSNGTNCDNEFASVKSAFQRLVARGVAIFVATGNNGYPDRVSFPACISNSIAVGATFDASFASAPYCPGMGAVTPLTIACFTNRGRALDILAPGVLITHPKMGGGLDSGAGTSFAAPMAAGVAALMFEANPDLRPSDVERILKNTGTPIRHPESGDEVPLVNALAAVEAVLPATATPTRTATAGPVTPTPTATATRTAAPTATGTTVPGPSTSTATQTATQTTPPGSSSPTATGTATRPAPTTTTPPPATSSPSATTTGGPTKVPEARVFLPLAGPRMQRD